MIEIASAVFSVSEGTENSFFSCARLYTSSSYNSHVIKHLSLCLQTCSVLPKSWDSLHQLPSQTFLIHLFPCVYVLQIATDGNIISPFSELHWHQSALNLHFRVFSWGKIVCFLFLGHEGDPCLRSSDCIEGHCCARHFWTKICKPVLHQGEVCTKQRKKGSHGLEIFQRCDCAKGLSCKVWKDATSSSKSRLHVCQKIWVRTGKVASSDCGFMYLMRYSMVGNKDCTWKRSGLSNS